METLPRKPSRTYTPEIIATPCTTCDVKPPNRCKPLNGVLAGRYNYPPHIARVRDSRKETEE